MFRFLDLPPVWMIAGAAAMMALSEFAPIFRFEFPGSGFFALSWIVLGAFITIWAARTLRKHQTTIVPGREPSALATNGPFAHTRNPIYLADVLILIGVATWLGALSAFVILPIFWWVMNERFIKPEEGRLATAFPQEFSDYAKAVPRWL